MLDRRLAAGLQKAASGVSSELAHNMVLAAESALRESPPRAVTGRELLYLVFAYYRMSTVTRGIHSLQDLLALSIKDGNIELFQCRWTEVLMGLDYESVSGLWLKEIYLKAVGSFKGISEEMAHFRRLPEAEQTYEYLHGAVSGCIHRKRRELVQEGGQTSLLQTKAQAAPAKAKGKGSPKGKGKGKSKGDRDKSGGKGSEQRAKKDVPCKWYNAPSGCKFGKGCEFKHGKGGARGRSKTPDRKAGEKGNVCFYFEKHGTCKFGGECRLSVIHI